MPKGKIAFVVGHSNWGKSSTLKALTGGSHHQRWITVLNEPVFIRRMSNDDKYESYIDFMRKLDPAIRPYLIAALCPVFGDQDNDTADILKGLRDKGYELFFWVIERKYIGSDSIALNDIERLHTFGIVEVFSRTAEAEVRAKNFKTFAKTVVFV